MQVIAKPYAHVCALLDRLQSPLLLIIRLYWGWQFAQTGWGKLQHLDRVAEFFASLSLPAPHATATFVALVEFLGGIFLALGLGTRLTAAILFINMTVAYWTADREALSSILSDPGKFYAADPFTFWFAVLLILILGPGKFAIDALFNRWFAPKS
ncbi:MAG TPA: DoxX family protein [Terracidiphilus sp.]|nr:DoxX family protein [Terracidiphilus sp.]